MDALRNRMHNDEKTTVAKPVSAQLRAENIAYAVQNGVYNLAANFFEPYIGLRVQKFYSKTHPGIHSGNYGQNLAGELAGDLIGSATLIAAEKMAPHQLHTCTRAIRRSVDPLYDKLAHKVLEKDPGSTEQEYQKKVEDWKVFQERNFARSMVMLTAGIAGNVATQKLLMGNPSPTSMIVTGKLISSSLTMALSLGSRIAFPHQAKATDRWIGKKLKHILEDDGYSAPEPEQRPASFRDRLHMERNAQKEELSLSV